jgi:hypothetical protein
VNDLDIVTVTEVSRLEWLGHGVRMDRTRTVKNLLKFVISQRAYDGYPLDNRAEFDVWIR